MFATIMNIRHVSVMYPGTCENLNKLSPIGMKLMVHLVTLMNHDNEVTFTVKEKQAFIESMRSAGKRISNQSIHNAIAELKRLVFIIDREKGSYVINSAYFSRGYQNLEVSRMPGAALFAPVNG